MARVWKSLGVGAAAAVVAAVAVAGHNAVDNTITGEDRGHIEAFLQSAQVAPPRAPRSYEAEIAFIADVQRAVLDKVSGHEPIDFDLSREPGDVLAAGTGECYDRSRLIEKALSLAGFETRHVAVYSTEETGSALVSLVTPQVSSHALTEVRTRRGWLLVDSNDPWLSLDAGGDPVDAGRLQAAVASGGVEWHAGQRGRMNWIFEKPFTFVYGLYSRHGRFFPPFNRVPDIHYGEFAQNFF